MSQPTSQHLLLALACAAALLLGAAPSALAAAPAPAGDTAKPSIMKLASDALSAPPPAYSATPNTAGPAAPIQARPDGTGLNRQVFGFAQAGALGDSTAGYPSWNMGLLSTVAYFGLHVNDDGSLNTSDTGWNVWNSAALTNLVNAAHAAGTRVVLTIVKQAIDSSMCSALQNSATTVAQTAAQVSAKGVDGVNIDYEGASATCGSSTNAALLVQLASRMRAALGPAENLTIDTYGASAAPGGDGFFNLSGLASSVDAFFVMAYELDNSNWGAGGLGCPSYCMSPTSPYGAYHWNDQLIAAQYSAAVGPGKTILGLPYYGWAACVQSATENALVTGSPAWNANTMLGVQGYPTGPQYTDRWDGVDHWYTYHASGTTSSGVGYDCQRELYIDDASTLSAKYSIVNSYGLQGAGIWSLDMGGGLSSLWNAIAVNFTKVPSASTSVVACPGDGFATVHWAAPNPGGAPITSSRVTGSPSGSATTGGPSTQAVVTGLTDGTAYSFQVQSFNGYGAGVLSDPSNSVTPAAAPAGSWPGDVHPLPPQRILDTRSGSPLAGNSTLTLPAAGRGGLPAASQLAAVVLNLTAVGAASPGYLTAYTPGTCFPGTSNLDFGAGRQDAALVEATVDSSGSVSIYNGGASAVEVLADVVGWVAKPSATGQPDTRYRAVTPTRMLDTRTATGGHPGALGPNQTLTLTIAGVTGSPVPTGATGVVVNLTATDTAAPGYLTAFPAGGSVPPTSSVNFGAADVVANRALVALDGAGRISVYNGSGASAATVIVDVVGYVKADGAAAGQYTGLTPVRIGDTRDGTGGVPQAPLGAGSWLTIKIAGGPGLPSGTLPSAAVLTLSDTNATASSYLYVDPTGTAVRASDLNFFAGQARSNLVVAPVGPDGNIHVYNSQGQVDVIVDLIGWYS